MPPAHKLLAVPGHTHQSGENGDMLSIHPMVYALAQILKLCNIPAGALSPNQLKVILSIEKNGQTEKRVLAFPVPQYSFCNNSYKDHAYPPAYDATWQALFPK